MKNNPLVQGLQNFAAEFCRHFCNYNLARETLLLQLFVVKIFDPPAVQHVMRSVVSVLHMI